MKRKRGAAVTADVAKWFSAGSKAIAADEHLYVESIAWNNKTANAGNNLTIEDEDGGSDIFRINLDVAGASGQIFLTSGRADDLGYKLPLGKDIKVDVSAGTTDCWLLIQTSSM